MGTIRYLEHTADAGVAVEAGSREELFVLGARALYQLVLEYDAVEGREERRLHLAAADPGELFHAWLAELLYLFDAEGMVFKSFGLAFTVDGLDAVLVGEDLDVDRHHPHGEIKNVTYCDYVYEERADGTYFARVIFDL
jgi:SHS2 domain-containing protein